MITLRKSSERGTANHGWLRSFHTFSFAEYYDPSHIGVGPLRVINEDTVAPNGGFGLHAHRDMEIISYVLEGRLAHKDSLGHVATIGPGTIQRMSAGTGIQHSEFNPSADEILHFLQIWIVPDHKGGKPRYDEAQFDLCSETSVVRPLVSGDGTGGTIPIDRDVTLSVAILPTGGPPLTHLLVEGRVAYCHVAKGTVTLSGHALRAGDAATFTREREIVLEDADDAQVLIFDMDER
jgi:redox-sensitive bicupin YhaK (pirin superfamily)